MLYYRSVVYIRLLWQYVFVFILQVIWDVLLFHPSINQCMKHDKTTGLIIIGID